MKEPLLSSSEEAYALEGSSYPPLPSGRPRSRSKPESIFIHPNHSNIARADAAAVQLGLAGDTDLVKGNVYPPMLRSGSTAADETSRGRCCSAGERPRVVPLGSGDEVTLSLGSGSRAVAWLCR